MHLACVLGVIFPLHELSAWTGKQGQLLCWTLVPHSSGGVWWVEAGSWIRIPLG